MITRYRIKFVLLTVALTIVIVIVLASLTFTAGLGVRVVKGKDMEPTLREGNRLLVTTNNARFKRGDIVIFMYPIDQSKIFVKRIVGVPGEIIEISAGHVYVNGQALEEKYVKPEFNRATRDIEARHIPEGEYYVMGDNRDSSNDSRLWGTLSAHLIVAKVLHVLPL